MEENKKFKFIMVDDLPKDWPDYLRQWVEIKKILGVPEGVGLKEFSLKAAGIIKLAEIFRNTIKFNVNNNAEQKVAFELIDEAFDGLDKLIKRKIY